MAIKLSDNYSKKLGLPQYSSHSFSASVEVELSDITQVEAEVQKLYQLLQHSVDQEIQHTGFVPTANSNGNGHAAPQTNGRTYPVNGNSRPAAVSVTHRWNCTDGQRGFILTLRKITPNHAASENRLHSDHEYHSRRQTRIGHRWQFRHWRSHRHGSG
jgi:hypothetical protein